MKKSIISLLISLLILLGLSPSVAASPMGDITASELYQVCESDNKVVHAVCITTLFTIVDTENTIANLLGAVPQMCLPDHYRGADYIAVFTTFLDQYPEYKDDPAIWVIIGAFRQLFPCKT